MKNIHVLPTDKPSRVYLIKSNNRLGITSDNPEFTENFGSGTQNQYIFITSDEEIKVGQNYIGEGFSGKNKFKWTESQVKLYPNIKKDIIILTTDQDLIKDGVQAIDNKFLEWFVKNPSCEEVEVEGHIYKGQDETEYKIIIPKEEPKQETLEEVARVSFNLGYDKGVEWQQERMYSEEEVLELLNKSCDYIYDSSKIGTDKKLMPNLLRGWFEQFKKK